jgi:hypothetical protein
MKKIFAFTIFIVLTITTISYASDWNWRVLLKNSALTPTRTYYVSNSGNDKNDGLSPSTPWKTIAKVNAMQYNGTDTNSALKQANPNNLYIDSKFKAGTHILFKRGDKWREKLFVISSGTEEKPVVFGAYGTGSAPIITGSECISAKCDPKYNWTKFQDDIYSIKLETSVVGSNPSFYGKSYYKDVNTKDAGVVTEDGKYLTFVPFGSDPNIILTKMKNQAGAFVYNYTSGTLYLRTFKGDDPDNHYIEVAVRDVGVKPSDSEYFIVRDLEISNTATGCVEPENVHHAIFERLHIHSCGGAWQVQFYLGNGMTIFHNSTFVTVQNSKIHDAYDSAISPQSFFHDNQTISNITIRNNEMYNAPHSVVEVTNWANTSTFDNIIIENNKIFNKGKTFSQKYQTNRPTGGPGVFVTTEEGNGSINKNIIIRNNRISGMSLDAVGVGLNSGPVYISNNIIKANKGAGIMIYNPVNNKTQVEIKNNIIRSNGAGMLYTDPTNQAIVLAPIKNVLKYNGSLTLTEQANKYMKPL